MVGFPLLLVNIVWAEIIYYSDKDSRAAQGKAAAFILSNRLKINC